MVRIGELLMFGIDGTKVTRKTKRLIKDTGCGGIILFSRNIKNPKQVAGLIDDLNDAAGGGLIIGVDQEGGRVERLKAPFTTLPPMARLAFHGDAGLALAAGRLLGRELSAIGFNIDFAPVLDVATNPNNPVIGDRSFSADPKIVANMAVQFVKGIEGEGVAACGKHFPGHGDTDVDSHLDLPLLNHDRRHFDELEFLPFRAAIDAGVASIMIAHLMIPKLDPSLPTTISRGVITGILRDEFKFNGVIFSDDLNMKGITVLYPPSEAAWRTITAGADIAMICEGEEEQRRAFDLLGRAVDDGKIDPNALSRSLARIAGFKSRFCHRGRKRPPMKVVGCEEHQKIAAEIW